MVRVAIVIVAYHSAEEIAGCLDSVASVPDAETIVVDNADADGASDGTADGTAELVRGRPGVRLIEPGRNLGFAGGVNAGVRQTKAPLVLLLNPDARLESGLDALIRRFDDPETGVAGGLLLGADGRPQEGFMARNLPTPAALICEVLGLNRVWPRNPANWHYRCKDKDFRSAARVEQPAGAFLMFRRSLWQELGGFDERFWPVWFEDVDFCARARQAGRQGWFEPAAVARHAGGHSVSTLSLEKRQQYWYGSLLEYAAKHYDPVTSRIVCLAVAAGSLLRAPWAGVRQGRKAFRVYGGISGLALKRLMGGR